MKVSEACTNKISVPFPKVEPNKPIEVTEVFVSSDMSMKVCPSGNYRVKSANENNSRISLVINDYLLDLGQDSFKVFL